MTSNEDDFQAYQEPELDESFNRFVEMVFNANTIFTHAENNFFNYMYNNEYNFEQRQEHNNLESYQEEEQGPEQLPQQEDSINNLINTIFPQLQNNLFNIFDYDPIESVLEESFQMAQESIEKTDRIIKISSQNYSTLSDNIKKDIKSCTICISDFENEDMISITNCNHIFHTDCIKEWGKYKIECPICRDPLE